MSRRKNEHLKKRLCCNCIIKGIPKDNKNYKFYINKDHSINYFEEIKKIEFNNKILNTYNDFENQCYLILDKIEN